MRGMADPAVGWVRGVVYAADDLEGLAAFWCAVLGTDVQYREPGWVELRPGTPGGALLAFQPRVATGPSTTVPVSIDLEVTDLDAAQARVEALGASLLEVIHAKPGEEHRLMADPEGNRFTLVLPFPDGWPGTGSAH